MRIRGGKGSACDVMISSERLPAQKGFRPSIITELQHYQIPLDGGVIPQVQDNTLDTELRPQLFDNTPPGKVIPHLLSNVRTALSLLLISRIS